MSRPEVDPVAARHRETLEVRRLRTPTQALGRKTPFMTTFNNSVTAAKILKQTKAPILTWLSPPTLLTPVTFIAKYETMTGTITTRTSCRKTALRSRTIPTVLAPRQATVLMTTFKTSLTTTR